MLRTLVLLEEESGDVVVDGHRLEKKLASHQILPHNRHASINACCSGIWSHVLPSSVRPVLLF